MDPRFEAALAQSNYRAIFENQKEKLKEVLKGRLLHPYNGGFLKIGPELLFEIKLYLDENKKRATILDLYMNPIDIENVEEFYKEIRSLYTEAINKYKVGLVKLKKSRQIETLVSLDLDEDTEE